MTPTELHQDFRTKLTALIREFHLANPEYLVNRIHLQNQQLLDGSGQFVGAYIEIVVQPGRGLH